MNDQTIPLVRVLEAQFIQGTKQIMHRVQLWLGHGKDPLIVWMTIEEWRQWCVIAHGRPDRIPVLAGLRQGMVTL
jgi:hypothetical protein